MRLILGLLLIIMPLSINTTAQTQTFTREGVEYVLDLSSPSWRAVSRVDVHEHLESLSTAMITATDICVSARR